MWTQRREKSLDVSVGFNRRLALRSHVIFSAMLEGRQIGCYGKQWLPRGIKKSYFNTQIFALIDSLFRNKTILIHSSNLNYTQRTSVIEHLHSLSLLTRQEKVYFSSFKNTDRFRDASISDSFIRFLQDFLCQGEVKSDKLKKLRKGSLVVCLRNAKIED